MDPKQIVYSIMQTPVLYSYAGNIYRNSFTKLSSKALRIKSIV